MALAPGAQLGSHQILGLLGAGGMGEVYRAHDSKLNRQVAIKVLPSEYAKDPDRVARFQREAQAVAALNHPGVAAIYEFAQSNDIGFLVLELVEGETLADRLRRGPVPVEEALTIAKEICEALEAAHEKGICHRDLKPANIKLTDEGKVKVLDFGLAKVFQDSAVRGDMANSPTLSLAGTLPGVILGTAGYMSPEQAKGFAADQRSDIFSLGCILYEMLTGRQVFEGDTASEILASVLKSEPDYTRLPSRLNPRLVELLRRCLEKQPKRRWHAVADVRVEIEGILARGAFSTEESRSAVRPFWRRALPVTAGVLVGAAIAGAGVWRFKPEAQRPITRFAVALPAGQQFGAPVRSVLAFAPDGSAVLYATNNRLFLRSMSDTEPRLIPGTETLAASSPVFSPDGRLIAFWSATDRTIKRISMSGGAVLTICRVEGGSGPYGISWSENGILFAHPEKGVYRVSSNGGTPELVAAVAAGERAATPQMLPGGRVVLFSVARGTAANRWDAAQIVAQPLGSSERKVLLEGGSDAQYVSAGYLIYALGATLLAAPFDPQKLEVTGGPTPVVEGVRRAAFAVNNTSTAHYALSSTGSLAYWAGPLTLSNAQVDLALIGRDGKTDLLKLPPASYQGPRVSPNGRYVAVVTDDGKESIVSVYELSGGSSIRRLTFGGNSRNPIWSADSEWVAFQSDREGDLAIFRQRADGVGAAERLTRAETGTAHLPEHWSPKGDRILYAVAKDSRYSLWMLTMPDRKTTPWGNVTSAIPPEAQFSPDGKWVAYQSDETGNSEIYVQPFPDANAKYMLPRDIQNHHPLWSPDGREIFYIPRQGVSSAIAVTTTPRFAFGASTPLDRGGRLEGPPLFHRNHDILPDGKRFLGVVQGGVQASGPASSSQIQIVLNWFEELKQRVPTP